MYQGVEEWCRLRISVPLLIAVILENSTKAICLLISLLHSEKLLVTLGGAIESMLSNSDATTKRLGPLSERDVRLANGAFLQDGVKWRSKRSISYHAVSGPRWWLSNGW